ncbi:uncharacterized protein LOC134838413 [Culicoides brevitarsis]|uniref:uncharacterized protein LOC134838413 n=1 Tax=Culicoides brevitarsis TaxID=469753 RepID=UPI00307BFF1D
MADALKLDDILSCPVCFDTFKPHKKILQCTQGHAICETCHEKLDNCPVCKEELKGTRNFVMEEMVKKLRRLSTGALMSLDDDVTPPTSQAKGVSEDQTDDDDTESDDAIEKSAAERKKEERKAKKKEKMKLKKQQKQQKDASEQPSTSSGSTNPTQTSPSVKRANSDVEQNVETKRQKTILREKLSLNSPPQPKGLFPCPTNDKNDPLQKCQSQIPFCRLYNHLRSLHADRLIETETIVGQDNLIARCEFEIPVPVSDYRHVIKVKEFGLFVLVFSAEREIFGDECTVNRVTGFVKMVGTVSAAKHFNYKLEVAIGKYVANCTDMCHYSFTDENSILLTDQCLALKVSKLSRFARIKLELSKNTGSRTRQPLTTNVQIIPNFGSSNHQGEASSHNRNQQKKKKKNKKH